MNGDHPMGSAPDDARNPVLMRPSHTVTTAWLAAGSIAVFVSLLFGTLQTVGLLAHEERTERTTISDPAVSVLDVSTQGGRVEVVGADVQAVHITARISDGLVATQVSHSVVGDRLQVRVRCVAVITGPWCRATLKIVVPSRLEVKVHADNDSVTIRGIDGRVDADSNDGTVEAEGLSGAAQLYSDNGSVRATRVRTDSIQAESSNGSVQLEFDQAPSSAIAHSDNGNVEVSLPRGDQGYAVDISSDNGSTENLVRTDSTSDHRIAASSSNGNVTVRYLS